MRRLNFRGGGAAPGRQGIANLLRQALEFGPGQVPDVAPAIKQKCHLRRMARLEIDERLPHFESGKTKSRVLCTHLRYQWWRRPSKPNVPVPVREISGRLCPERSFLPDQMGEIG